MLEQFKTYLTENQLITTEATPLLAVSGGVDSVVMCDLFFRLGIDFGITHCNFLLRGKMSDEDEEFVAELAKKYDAKYFSQRFDTERIAADSGRSIQLVARDLRYAWFAELLAEGKFTCIATAHHLNDSIETVLFHLTRGTGIRGLAGVPVQRKQIIRPLSFATKDEILAYAEAQNLAFREDVSNTSTKYARNKIRLEVVPKLKSINPALETTFATNIEHFKAATALVDFAIAAIKKDIFSEKENVYSIDIKGLRSYPASQMVLFELLKIYDFNTSQVAQIYATLDGQAGAQFVSPTHVLLRDRGRLIIQPIHPKKINTQFIEKTMTGITFAKRNLQLERISHSAVDFGAGNAVAYLDEAALSFPLTLRYWRLGDVFQPLGMGGRHQKLSDFFTNKKLTQFDKEKVLILTTGEQICWVVGHRIDERFKVKKSTQHILKLTVTNS